MIDVILATINKFPENKNIFESLKKQTFKEFRVIIIHQGNDEFDFNLVEGLNYEYFNIKEYGLSMARNIGLKHSDAPLISFIDDDAQLEDRYFEKVVNEFSRLDIKAMFGVILDPQTLKHLNRAVRNKTKAFYLERKDYKYCISSALTIRQECKIYFDEYFGLGRSFGGGEDDDYFFNIYEENKILFSPNIIIFHDNDEKKIKQLSFKSIFFRGFSYGKGKTGVFKKHYLKNNDCLYLFFTIETIFFSFLGIALDMINFNYRNIIRNIGGLFGKINGFINYKNKIANL
jgi:glycosyltransferase involved in cell wall biosynthesis